MEHKYDRCMKTITINVSEPVYSAFQQHARNIDRTTSELVREAMADYYANRIQKSTSIRDLPPLRVGKVLKPFTKRGDLLEEMLDD